MKKIDFLRHLRDKAAGQSLVETAIFLPIILFLLAGVLEISNMLITQNRVQTAARVGTGFGATNYDASIPITDTFEAMSIVALNNVTETLDLAPERWDIYTVKATVNPDADGFTEWVWDHPFGSEQVFAESEWTANEPQIQSDILNALEDSANGMEIVSTVSYHNRDSFVGLGYFNPGLTRIRGLTVMRVSETSGDYAGCDLFPISLHVENISLYPENYPGSIDIGAGEERYQASDWEGSNSHIIPDHDYDDGPTPPDHSGFPYAEGGHRLVPGDVQYGDIYEARELASNADADDVGQGNFGWLTWDGSQSGNVLRDSLTPPGNLSLTSPPPEGKVNYENPDDADDIVPNVGDWVQGTSGNINGVTDIFDEHVDSERPVQIVVFDDVRGGGQVDYRIAGFVLVYLRGRQTGTNDKRILVEFIQWAEPCFAPDPNP